MHKQVGLAKFVIAMSPTHEAHAAHAGPLRGPYARRRFRSRGSGAGASPNRTAAVKNTYGSGFPRVTSRPVTRPRKQAARPSESRTSRTFSGGPEKPTAKRSPA